MLFMRGNKYRVYYITSPIILNPKKVYKTLFPLNTMKIKPEAKTLIKNILKKNKVKRAGIFGSYARGEENKESDHDVL